MAHFRATIQGARGEASRLGGKSSGIYTTTRGWNIGVDCHLWYDAENDRDILTVTVDRGSGTGNGSISKAYTIIDGVLTEL